MLAGQEEKSDNTRYRIQGIATLEVLMCDILGFWPEYNSGDLCNNSVFVCARGARSSKDQILNHLLLRYIAFAIAQKTDAESFIHGISHYFWQKYITIPWKLKKNPRI